MNLTFAANLTKMIDAGLGREAAPPETFVAVGRTREYTDLGPVPIASFETNVEAPLRALSVAMEPIQAGTGDPSPENVRPITGRDTVTVTRSGVNVWDGELEVGGINDSTGEKTSSPTQRRSANFISVMPNTDYYAHTIGIGAGGIYVYYYDANYSFIGRAMHSNGYNIAKRVFTTPNNCQFIMFKAQITGGSWDGVQFSINYPSTDHDYHPGTVQSVAVQLGQTVYGGTLDVVSGVLTVDKRYIALDNTASWEMATAGKFYASNVTSNAATGTDYISNHYLFSGNGSTSSNNVTVDKRFYGQRGYGRIWVYDSQYETLEDFKAALATTPLQIVYPITTPLTVQLNPEQITTLIGQNNVWSDGGDVSLTYGTTRYTEGY